MPLAVFQVSNLSFVIIFTNFKKFAEGIYFSPKFCYMTTFNKIGLYSILSFKCSNAIPFSSYDSKAIAVFRFKAFFAIS